MQPPLVAEGVVAKADSGEKPKASESENVFVPLALYTPETHVGLGALYVHIFRMSPRLVRRLELSRPSSLAFLALGTTRRQLIFEAHADLYWGNDNVHASGKLEYQRFPDSFWGIGNEIRDEDEERYQRERARLRASIEHRIIDALYAGLRIDAMEFAAQFDDPDGIFATQDVPGELGGFTLGAGPVVTLDTRDNAVATRDGAFVQGAFLVFDDLVASDYDFRRLSLDGRLFFPIAQRQALGLHLYSEFLGGGVPFYQLAMLGGDELLRGYFLGKYRDKNLLTLEAEFRTPLFWRFGAVTFIGAGRVAERPIGLASAPLRWAGGGGLRFALSEEEGLNLRLDVGVGPGTHGVYFTAREAF